MSNARGIDTSHYNGLALDHVIAGTDFVIAQCTVGTSYDSVQRVGNKIVGYNPVYLNSARLAKNFGKPFAGYHYAVYGPGPTRQAKFFIANATADADWLMVDAEARGSNGLLSHPDTINALIINIRKLDPHKRKITLYASRDTAVSTPRGPRSIWEVVTAQDGNHVALYAPNAPTHPTWKFWQYSGTGIDHDEFNGSVAQLKGWYSGR